MLLRTFSSCSYAVKLQLFMSYCGSMYTAFLWWDFTKRQYRHLEVAYNNVFRRLMGYDKYCSASGMYVENRTDGFDARVRKLVYGFRERLDISDNSVIETVINSSTWRSSKLLQLWEDYLFWPLTILQTALLLCLYFFHDLFRWYFVNYVCILYTACSSVNHEWNTGNVHVED